MEFGRARGIRPGRRSSVRAACLVGLVLLLGPTLLGPTFASGHGQLWQVDAGELNEPFASAARFTAMALSADGEVLAAGLDNGGVLFVNATTGRIMDAAQAADRGALSAISLSQNGTRAALVYQTGYIAVVDMFQDTPLVTLNEAQGGVPADVRPRVAAKLTSDGGYLVVTGAQVRVLVAEEANGEMRFRQVGGSSEQVGPFVYLHPALSIFGAVSPGGVVAIYSYNNRTVNLEGQQTLPDDGEGPITAFGVSANGGRFAIGYESGAVRRYQPNLFTQTLVLDYEAALRGAPRDLFLDETGLRLAAWSDREVFWTEGRNRNYGDDEAKAAAAAEVVVRPPFAHSFTSVEMSADLLRMFARFQGDDPGSRLYNLPELDFFAVEDTVVDGGGLSRLDGPGRTVFQSRQHVVEAFVITEKQLAPPARQETDGEAGADGDGQGLFGETFSTTTALLAGGMLLVLLLVAVLIPLLLAARRRGPVHGLPSLDDEGPPTPIAGPLGGPGPARTVPPVASSAPLAEAPPDGILVLRDLHVQGARPLGGIGASWQRAGVVRIHGAGADLEGLLAGLSGRAPVTGLIAVGGASAAETPMLFSRRIQAGLPALPGAHLTPDDGYRAEAERHRLPGSLVARRIGSDLAWLGDKRGAAMGALAALDAWKLRVAFALIHRPQVLLLSTRDLPDGVAARPKRAEAVGKVLRGVSRHFDVLVLLLDDGALPEATVRSWCHEERALTPNGLRERVLLRDGTPVQPKRRRTRSTRDSGSRRRR